MYKCHAMLIQIMPLHALTHMHTHANTHTCCYKKISLQKDRIRCMQKGRKQGVSVKYKRHKAIFSTHTFQDSINRLNIGLCHFHCALILRKSHK